MANAKDWTGMKFHKLTFIRPTNIKHYRIIKWEVQCDCPNQTIKIVRPADVIGGSTKSCGCYNIPGVRNRTYEPKISSARSVWSTHHYNDGDITFDEFMTLSQLNCHYCGKNHTKYTTKQSPKLLLITLVSCKNRMVISLIMVWIV